MLSASHRCARVLGLVCSVGLLASACSGQVGGSDPLAAAGPDPGGEPRVPGSAGPGPGAGEPTADLPAPSPRVVRLTHAQWQNTVADLLYLASDDDVAALSAEVASLRDDPKQGGFVFDNDAEALVVDGALWSGYQQAAAVIAERVATDPVRLRKLMPGGAPLSEVGRDAFVDHFGERAHRRPLVAEDRTAYRALFDLGPSMYTGMDADAAGARLVIEAVLQSPLFLYRSELSGEGGAGAEPLDGYEVASRLSYFLWNTMPDDSLLGAAADGSLVERDGVASQVRRMVIDPRAVGTVVSFHDQLLESDKLSAVMPSATAYGNRDGLGRDAREERRLFVSHIFDQGGTLADLLTSRETFVNGQLAEVYGLGAGYGDAFELAELDPAQRAGLFTQVGFLATHAASVDPDPIHRGKFIAERMTCKQISAPPTNVPAPPVVSDKTNRQRIADYTEMPGSACAACHATVINPFGFPFESFDAIGSFRTEDRGMPVDTATSPPLDGMPTPVADAVELADALSTSAETHRCYVKHWLEFAQGRHEHALDDARIERIAEHSLDEGLSLPDLLVELVLSDGFLTRTDGEAP